MSKWSLIADGSVPSLFILLRCSKTRNEELDNRLWIVDGRSYFLLGVNGGMPVILLVCTGNGFM